MTLGFVVQTYRGVEQISRLARTLRKSARDCAIVVSHRGTDEDYERLRAEPAIDQVIPSPGGRGSFGNVDGLLASIRYLERTQTPYGWLTILSGQDYPIRPLREFEDELKRTAYDAYFHHFDASNAADAAAAPMHWSPELIKLRYYFQYVLLKEHPSRLERMLLRLPRVILDMSSRWRLHTSFAIMVGRRAEAMPFTEDFRLHGGNYWMTMSRKAACTLVDFVDDRPDVVEYFRATIAPEEAFLATVLANTKGLRLSNRELRFMDFAGTRHGAVRDLCEADLKGLLANECFFARKFRSTDVELTEALDRRVFAGKPVSTEEGEAAVHNASGQRYMMDVTGNPQTT